MNLSRFSETEKYWGYNREGALLEASIALNWAVNDWCKPEFVEEIETKFVGR